MIELILVPSGDKFEYLCESCGHLRLCFDKDRETCGNCGSDDITCGPVGTLEKPGADS